jgi:cytochrome c oxidase subunit 2
MFNLALPEAMMSVLAQTTRPHGWLMPEAHGNHAQYVDYAMDVINFITVFFFVLIVAAMIIFVLKFRRTSPHDRAKSQMGHNTALELSWTLPPVVIVVFIFYLGFSGYMKIATMPAEAYEVNVTAQKWLWTFTHPSGRQGINELDVPAGTAVRLLNTSRDVIHSVYIPVFRIKKDAVPGRYNRMWFMPDQPTPHADDELPTDSAAVRKLAQEQLVFEAEQERANQPTKKFANTAAQDAEAALAKLDEKGIRAAGERRLRRQAVDHGHILYCTEFCGTNHSLMLAKVVVHKKGWIAPPETIDFGNPAEAGKKIMARKGCTGCHQIPGAPASTVQAPSFARGIFGKTEELTSGSVQVDENYIRESIVNPQAKIVKGYLPIMPIIPVTDQEIDAIIGYLKSIPLEK